MLDMSVGMPVPGCELPPPGAPCGPFGKEGISVHNRIIQVLISVLCILCLLPGCAPARGEAEAEMEATGEIG